MVGQGASLAAAFGVQIVLVHSLNPSEYGALLLIMSLVAFGATITRAGLNRIGVSFVSRELTLVGSLGARAAARVVLLSAAACASVTFIIYGIVVIPFLGTYVFNQPFLKRLAWLIAAACALEGCRLAVSETFRGFHRIGRSVIFGDAARRLLFFLAVVLFAAWGTLDLARVTGLLAVSSAVVASAAAIALTVATRPAPWRGWRPTGHTIRPAWKTLMFASLPLVVVEIANQSVSQGDIIVIGAVSSTRDVAIYGAASRVSLLLLLPSVVLTIVLGSVITDLHARGQIARLERLLQRAALIATVPMLLITVAIWVFGGNVLGLVFGDTYRAGALVLTILVVGPLANTISGLCGLTLVMTGHQRTVAWVAGFAGPLTITLEVAAGHLGGMSGIAAASSCGTVLQNAVLTVQARRKTGILTLPLVRRTTLQPGRHRPDPYAGSQS